jgi:hypothetical protein
VNRKNVNYAPHKHFSIVRKGLYKEVVAYKRLYGELVYYVDHYYYANDSKEMKYMLGVK